MKRGGGWVRIHIHPSRPKIHSRNIAGGQNFSKRKYFERKIQGGQVILSFSLLPKNGRMEGWMDGGTTAQHAAAYIRSKIE